MSKNEPVKPRRQQAQKGAWAHTRLQRTANTEVASSHASPVAEKAHNARKQQELAETSPTRPFSPRRIRGDKA